jgi:uncharacterized protein YlxW (UPF0749 family)
MSTIAPSVRGKSWVFQVTALCIVLGMLLALSLKTHRAAVEHGEPSRSTAVGYAFWAMRNDNVKLRKDVADYKDRFERLARAQAKGVHTSDFQRLFDENKVFAGTVGVHGPGIVVLLKDSPKRNTSVMAQENLGDYIIHDRDVREVVNELCAAGAEAIAVNGQRLVADSSIRCVGPVVRVNSTPIAAPFFIKAIGDPETLENALKMPGGPADGLFLLGMIEVAKQPDLVLPAFKGSTRLIHVHQLPERSSGN